MASGSPRPQVPRIRIGTHSGTFHCDEVLACYMLKLLPEYQHAEIIRSRDEADWNECAVLVDVGGRYDPGTHRYDHHQRDFKETAASVTSGWANQWTLNSTIKLSSAGLVYCHFAPRIIKQIVPSFDSNQTTEKLNGVLNYVYDSFIQEIDAFDNGELMFKGKHRFHVHTSITARVGNLNRLWNEPPEDARSMERFEKAMVMVGEEFKDRVQFAIESWWPARLQPPQQFPPETMTCGPPRPTVPVPRIRIGTHSGTFHCDEVLACYMLKLLPEYQHAEIIRSRDEAVWNECDVLVDVGERYDPGTHRYDHHQRDFKETAASVTCGWANQWTLNSTIKLSSAGLVYCHFAPRIIKQIVPSFDSNQTKEKLDGVLNYVYESFIKEIDAFDNGEPMFKGKPRFNVCTGITARVGYLNRPWNKPPEDARSMERFEKAMVMVGEEFRDRVQFAVESWLPARQIVLDAINNRYEVHGSGMIIELKPFCPWKDHYREYESKFKFIPKITFLINFDEGLGVWWVHVIRSRAKLRLAPDWWGLSGEQLCTVSGIPECRFVHSSGFIGLNSTREGALAMAVKSLEY